MVKNIHRILQTKYDASYNLINGIIIAIFNTKYLFIKIFKMEMQSWHLRKFLTISR